LNIYVPREQPNPEEKLNVIVHIHGGGFTFGNGHFYAHPEYLMDRDAILVTFNYRLGILGFLSTEDAVIPGNNGLKDQVLALKWVQKNIACFGGNPGSVTITGASAGAASVHLHYLSPMSRGLFHRGLSNSGCAFNPWTMQKGAEEKSKILASAVGCPEAPSERLLKCLKQRSYRQILNKITLFYGYKFEPAVPFGPVVETGPKPFLDQHPYQLFVKGEVQDLPWVSSYVAHEGKLLTLATFNDNIEEINADWKKSAPFTLYYNYTIARPVWSFFTERIKEDYLGKNQNVNDENFNEFVKIFTDRVFVYDGVAAAKLHAGATNSSVYFYFFSYTDNGTTVQHADDIQYFFSGNVVGREPTENELKMKDVMLDMLMAYAKTE
ncbi:COesterase and/or Abhydrolase 3 domain containing protein, partial [Asbolus verrucosus]